MAFAAARMIKDKEAKMIAGQKRSTEINQSYSKYNLQKVKEQGRVTSIPNYKWFSCSHYRAASWQNSTSLLPVSGGGGGDLDIYCLQHSHSSELNINPGVLPSSVVSLFFQRSVQSSRSPSLTSIRSGSSIFSSGRVRSQLERDKTICLKSSNLYIFCLHCFC